MQIKMTEPKIVNVNPSLTGGPHVETPPPPSPNPVFIGDAKPKEVESDVSGVGWKEIVLTRDDFKRLSDRLNRHNEVLVEEKDDKLVFVFLFPMLYFILMFKDDLPIPIPEVLQGVLKVLLFIVAVYYMMYDNTLKKMGVNITSRLLIGFCFGGLLVASSSVV